MDIDLHVDFETVDDYAAPSPVLSLPESFFGFGDDPYGDTGTGTGTGGFEAGELPGGELADGDLSDGGLTKEDFEDLWFAQTGGTCGMSSATQILDVYYGTHTGSEAELVEYAYERGWTTADGDGIVPRDIAKLLTENGVPAHVEQGMTIEELDDLLEEGHGVIAVVDSGDYWNPEIDDAREARGLDDGRENHAVVVSEVDYENGVVYLSDTGTGGGNMIAVPIEDFMEAWAAGGDSAIVCDEPAPQYAEAAA